MTDRQQLREILRPVGEVIVPAREQRKLAAMSSAFGDDGRIRSDALARTLPAYTFTWYLSGSLSAGTNVAEEYDLPSMIRLVTLRARAKTAPSGTCTIRLTANGTEVETVAISAGESRGVSPLNMIADAGTVLRIDIVTTGSAADVTVLAGYAPVSI